LDALVTQGMTWTFDQCPQNRSLISWLREYNAEPGHRRHVNFYGFDTSGGPSTTRTDWSHDLALAEVLNFLDRVDLPASTAFRAQFEPFIDSTRFHPRRPLDGPCYGRLEQSERDAITAAINDLIVWLERHEGRYEAASTADAYAWACRAAIAMRQADNCLRTYPTGWMPSSAEVASDDGLPLFMSHGSDVRDRAQADNLDWILEQEGPAGKVLVFAARYHLSAAALKASWHPHRVERTQEVAGTYMRRRFGERIVTIANLIGQGEAGFGEHRYTLGQAPAESLDGLCREIGTPLFLLDLRGAPASLSEWLGQEHRLVAGTQMLKLPLRHAFDILFYTDTVTVADERAALAQVS
jgi:erythromycin esterase